MTDSIKISTVTATIATQTISVVNAYGSTVNVTIKDTSAIPVTVNQQDCPLLSPLPPNFMSGVTIRRDTYGGDAGLKTIEYDLTYRFFYCPALQGVSQFEKYDEMVTAAAAVLLHFATHTSITGSTDIMPRQPVPFFGPVVDGGGNVFHGFDLVLHVMQYMET